MRRHRPPGVFLYAGVCNKFSSASERVNFAVVKQDRVKLIVLNYFEKFLPLRISFKDHHFLM